jgi:hypothetical protein
MKGSKTFLWTFIVCAIPGALPGCYSSTSGSQDTSIDGETAPDPGQDPVQDPPPDGWPCDESTITVDSVAYSRVVPPMTPFDLVVTHESAVAVRLDVAAPSTDNVIEIEVLGYPLISTCLCNDGMWCGPPGTSERVTRHTLEGLPAGEYVLRINGVDYPLLVAGPECLTYATTIGEVVYNDYLMRGDAFALFEITSLGHSCSCGGDTGVEQRVSEATSEIWIDITEVVCHPEQCCDTCNCIDSFQDTVFVWLDTYYHYSYVVHINGNDYPITIPQPLE